MTGFERMLYLFACAVAGPLTSAHSAAFRESALVVAHAGGARHELEIRAFEYTPRRVVKVAVGDTVVWLNRDAVPHTATAVAGAWTTGNLNGGQRAVFVPRAPGDYEYHCVYHASMKGVISVRASPSDVG
jgi:plastocyanin